MKFISVRKPEHLQSKFIFRNEIYFVVSLNCLVVLFYSISTLFRSFNTEVNFKKWSLVKVKFLFTVKCQTVQLNPKKSSVSKNSV